MGYISVSTSLAIILAPLLGGVVYARAGYYSVFAMAFGLIAMDIFLRLVMIEKSVAKQWMSTLQAGEVPASGNHVSHTFRLRPIVLGTLYPTREEGETSQQGARPSIVLLLRSPRFVAALWGSLVQAILVTAFDTVCTIYSSTSLRDSKFLHRFYHCSQ